MNAQYDIAIIGGGPVGAALALALRDSKLKVCVLEARPANAASQDARALALSYGSRLLLERLGVWDALHDVSAIRTIHISQKQSFGRAVLHAEEMNVPELGYVLPYPALQDALTDALQHSDVASIYGASVTQLTSEADHAVIGYQQDGTEHTLHTRLAVVADGGKLLAQQYPPEVRDYGQSALITHITCSAPQAETAFERFTPQGPLALLPFKEGYELVWTAPHQAAQDMLAWDDAKFLRRTAPALRRPRRRIPDRQQTHLLPARPEARAATNADAAHRAARQRRANPASGRRTGFQHGAARRVGTGAGNTRCRSRKHLGSEAMLAAYRAHRRTDREAGIRFTDGLVRLFSNDLPLISAGRAAALTALDCLPFVKKFVAKRMMFGANG